MPTNTTIPVYGASSEKYFFSLIGLIAESARARNTDIFVPPLHDFVQFGEHHRFVNINFLVRDFRERLITRIQINSHDKPH